MPPFFLASSGGTNIRTIIQTIAAIFFLLAGLMLFQPSLKSKSSMLHWYSLGLLLMGLSMGGSIIVKSVGTPFSWTLRIAQLLGGVYILLASVDTLNEARSRQISVGDVMADSFNEIKTKLKTSEEQLRIVIENDKSGVALIDQNGRFTIFNSAFLDMFGLSQGSDVLNVNSQDWSGWKVFEEDGKTLLAVDDHPVRKAALTGLAQRNKLVGVKLPSGGKLKWLIINAEPLLNEDGKLLYVVATYYDITERKEAETAVKNNEKLLQSFFDSPGIMRGIVEIVDDTTVRHIADNVVTAGFVGLPAEALRNKLSSELGEPPEIIRTWVSHYRRSLETGMPVTFEYEDNRVEKKTWLSATVSYLKTADSGQQQFTYVVLDVTERKKAEEALKASEEKYHNLFETMSEGFILAENVNDDDGKPIDYRLLDANSACERYFGCPRSELIGRTYRTIGGEKADAEWIEKLTHVALTGEPVIIERYAPVVGQWVSLKAYSPRVGQFAAFFENITERKKAEEALKASEEQFQALANNIPQLAWMADGEGWIFWYNQRWYDYTGTNLEEMKGWGWQKVHHPDYVEPVTEKFKKYVATGAAWEDTFPLRGKDGNYRWFLSRAFAIRDNNGKVMRWFGTNTDITEKLEVEENLRRYSSDLEVSNKELEAFAYSVSHDLRAPLRTLDGFSQAVIDDYGDKLDDTGKDYLRRVRDAAKHMDQITKDMLMLSRVIRSELRMGDVSLSNIVSVIAKELSEKEPTRKVKFIMAPDVMVKGDSSLLQMALYNLLENAWKFTAKMKESRIEFGTMIKDNERIYFVSDNGVGFDMQYVDKLFQPFQRLHTGDAYPGTGIGLATVQRVIRRHGGRIWAESQVGKGTTFYFTLG
jgi:PAS domain S-box-containing protein